MVISTGIHGARFLHASNAPKHQLVDFRALVLEVQNQQHADDDADHGHNAHENADDAAEPASSLGFVYLASRTLFQQFVVLLAPRYQAILALGCAFDLLASYACISVAHQITALLAAFARARYFPTWQALYNVNAIAIGVLWAKVTANIFALTDLQHQFLIDCPSVALKQCDSVAIWNNS